MKLLLPCFIFSFCIFALAVSFVFATSQNVDVTVKNSICGNTLKESGEECDNNDLNGKLCTNLGFSGGTLSCNVACDFNTLSCNAPSVLATNVTPEKIDSLVAAGYFVVPSSEQITSTTSVSTTTDVTINLPEISGKATSILLPSAVTISREDGKTFDPTKDLGVSSISASEVSGLTGIDAVKSVQWGVEGTALTFDSPITINLFVGTGFAGQDLTIYRSENLSSGWTTTGLVNATCTITADGFCNFQTSLASYFVAAKPGATPAPTPTTSSSSSTTSSSSSSNSSGGSISSSTASTPASFPVFRLPAELLPFDVHMTGHLNVDDLETMITIWIDSWKSVINRYPLNGEVLRSEKCDIDMNKNCDIKDFSVLMYYVGR